MRAASAGVRASFPSQPTLPPSGRAPARPPPRSYVAACAPGGGVAPATGRPDVDAWRAAAKETFTLLARPRISQMPVADWADPRDAAYARWKYETKFGFDYAGAVGRTAELLPQASELLAQLEPLLRGADGAGAPCLNAWGFTMDDVLLLPDLRQLSCVRGVQWPLRVREYLDAACAQAPCKSYEKDALP